MMQAPIAASVLSIQHARSQLRRELIAALACGDKASASRISLARDTMARIEMDLKACAGAAVQP